NGSSFGPRRGTDTPPAEITQQLTNNYRRRTLAALSLAVMPILSAAQRKAGRELGSASAVADSKQTLLCTYLSAVLLVGLVLNATLGWSWTDPIAALVIAAIAVKEGRDAWQGKGCCATPAPAVAPTANTEADVCGCRPGCDCCN
ncbi:cation transporter, partial [Streptomyces sp. NPDC020096]